ncbi:MAG TPA: hypothetical protein VGK18_15810, partial [Propionicimonas sp.]|uniref:hypothetical protein n=1 Tax=Propionicimonas sp. TaxID=1955623 RepID=UPI002F4137BF
GPVRVVAHIGAGGVRIELLGATDQAREALRAALPDLRRDLVAAGLPAELDLGSGTGSGRGHGTPQGALADGTFDGTLADGSDRGAGRDAAPGRVRSSDGTADGQHTSIHPQPAVGTSLRAGLDLLV